MELIDRYVYAVVSRLLPKQREDIEKELRGLIEDMLEERTQGQPPTVNDVEEVLTELGRPSELAAQYRGYNRYLISPEMFDSYWVVLKIVEISIIIGLSAVFVIRSLIAPLNILDIFVESIVGILTAMIQGFAWVTIGFAIAEYAGVKKEQTGIPKARWTPSDLPPIPNKKAQIPISEPIFGIIFSVFFFFMFMFAGGWNVLPGWVNGSTVRVVVFDAEVLSRYLPWVAVLFLLLLIREVSKLISRKWTAKLITVHAIISVATFLVLFLVFNDASIWNPHFMNEWVQAGVMTEGSDGYQIVSNIWDHVHTWFRVWIVIGCVMDLIFVLWNVRKIR